MTRRLPPLTGWQQAAAAGVEGLFLLTWLLARLAECGARLWLAGRPQTVLPEPFGSGALAAVCTLLQGLLLAPLRLGRLHWYRRLCTAPEPLPSLRPLAVGWRQWKAALGWRWRLWWRRMAALMTAALPAMLLWSFGAADAAAAPLWLPAGALALAGGAAAAALWLCRYASAPLLVLEGYPAGAALQLSVRIMRGHRGAYVNFYGSHAAALLSCLLLVPAFWVLPRFHRDKTALLLQWRQTAALPAEVSAARAQGHPAAG